MEKTEKMIAAEKLYGIEYTEETEIADAIIDNFFDEEMTLQEALEAAKVYGGEIETRVKNVIE